MKRFFEFFKQTGNRAVVLLISTMLLITMAVGTTVALIMAKTDTTGNTFDPPVVRISLEGYDDITNAGTVPLYVRSLGVVNWVSKEDEKTILSEVPKSGEDFSVYFVTEDWFLASDGFYYYSKPLYPGETVILFTEAVQLTKKDGYELHLRLLSGSIQAYPVDAVEEAWPAVQVDPDGNLVEKEGYTR